MATVAVLVCASPARAASFYVFTIQGTGNAIGGTSLGAQTATSSFAINADPANGGAAPDWNFSGFIPGALAAFSGTVVNDAGTVFSYTEPDLQRFRLVASPTEVTAFSYTVGENSTFPRMRFSSTDATANRWIFAPGLGGENTISWDVANATIEQVSVIPEPEALASTMAAAAFGLLALRRRRRKYFTPG